MTLALIIQKNGQLSTIDRIGPGDDGTAKTIAAMQGLVDDALADPITRPRLDRIAAGLPRSNPYDFGAGLYTWCRSYIEFQRDPTHQELIRHPADTLDLIRYKGRALVDCEDLATTAAAIAAAGAQRPVFITVGRGSRFQHVFWGLLKISSNSPIHGPPRRADVIPFDPQEAAPIGVWPGEAKRTRLWRITANT